MHIAIGSDHRGFELKKQLTEWLREAGHSVNDMGTDSDRSVDYPDFAGSVAQAVGADRTERGVLICGSGIGMAIAANKIGGVRAAMCYDERSAEMSRRHNDANVLCLSADGFDAATNLRILKTWIRTDFEGGRHGRRVDKIRSLETGCQSSSQ